MEKTIKRIVTIFTIMLFAFIIFGKNNVEATEDRYYITVNYGANVVTIYENNGAGSYIPYKSMVCSTGESTPKSGTYSLDFKYRWLALYGGVAGQYCSRVVGNILIHSVPYTVLGDPSSLEYWEYDKLGETASAGCIRLTTEDAKWVYENCPSGTKVTFFSSSDTGPLGKPSAMKISNFKYRGWDPTDDDTNNPWKGILDATFNATYYANKYSDLKGAYGYDEKALKSHWYSYGVYEGRSSSPTFDVRYYLENNKDLKAAFGNSYYSAYVHYLNNGYLEDRKTSGNFDVTFYKNFYDDLSGLSNLDASLHYNRYGINER